HRRDRRVERHEPHGRDPLRLAFAAGGEQGGQRGGERRAPPGLAASDHQSPPPGLIRSPTVTRMLCMVPDSSGGGFSSGKRLLRFSSRTTFSLLGSKSG